MYKNIQGYYSARNFYIPDTDKRKHLELQASIIFNGCKEVVTVQSNPVKIISKPSKKKQSAKNTERKFNIVIALNLSS